jgi:hypothetical protein
MSKAFPPSTVMAYAAVALLAVYVTSFLTGCAPQLAVSAGTAQATSAPLSGECQRLSRLERAMRYTSTASAALAGASGLSTIPVDDPEAREAMAVTAASLGVVAVTAEVIRQNAAADFVERCR